MNWQEKEITIPYQAGDLYGKLYMPAIKGRHSTVIISHGFGGSYRDNENFARYFAENGIVACVYDFLGGSMDSRSGGDSRKMSVLTEVEELSAVIDYFKSQDFVDTEKLFLLGESQGGFVSALGAVKRKDDICALMMLYPAFCIVDDGKKRFLEKENIPAESEQWGMLLGRKYYTDIWDMDIYHDIAAFDKPVLLFHGTKDELVDLSYSQKAAAAYKSARLEIVEGAGHGFFGHEADRPAEIMVDFVNQMANGH